MSLPSSNWFSHWAVRAFANAHQSGKIQIRRRRSRRPAQQISLESLEPRQMLSVNPASSGSSASSAKDNSNIAAFVSQNTIGILAVVPSAPRSVVAVSGNASLAVTWAAPVSTGGSNITDYLVKYSSNSGVAWTTFTDPVSTATSCTVTGLTNGTAYVIRVVAKNAVGSSLPSANSATVTPATVPSKPTSVVAVRGNASLAVTWTVPASTGGSPITDYVVKYSSNGGSTWTNFVHPVSTVLSCTVTGLTNGTPSVIKVIAKNAIGISPPSANSASVTPAATVPGSPTSVGATVGQGQLGVMWVPPASPGGSAITDYLVSYSSNGGASWTAFPRAASTATSCTVTGLTYGTSYVIQVVARNGFGISLPSANSAPATPAALVPGSPTSVVAVSGNIGQVPVTWAAPVNTNGSAIYDYLVSYSNNGGASWTLFPRAASTATSCTVTGLTNGTSYVIQVVARNAEGNSLPSANSAPATPAALVPGSPTSVVAVSGNIGQVPVTWAAPVNTNRSAIYDYLVSYSNNGGASWTLFPRAASTATSCTVTGLINGKSYVIQVVARNAAGNSLPSANSAPVIPKISMNLVTVGDAGNAADTTSYGAVSYSYQIGAYDVTGSEYAAFLNVVGKTDTYGLYNASMGTDTSGAQISRSGTSGSYAYVVMNSTGNRPISYVSWFDCARFSNWMVNGQGSGSTETGAYTLVGGQRAGTAPAAKAGASFRIPTENDWYKAAYFKGSSTNAGYWTYATQSNSAPGTATGSGANQANHNNAIGHATDVGSFTGSGSFYGTFDQSGNVFQWNDLAGTAGLSRGLRGGSWTNDSYTLSSSNRIYSFDPSNEYNFVGFRLVSGPLVPSVPTVVAAVSGISQLAVTWVAPASTGGSAITDYLVKYSSNGGSTWTNFPHPVSTALSCTVTGLTNGTSYIIKVIAKNAIGISLPSVNSAPVTPLAAALTPTFRSTTATADGFRVQISNYDLSYSWAGTATASGTVAISDTGLVTVTGVAANTSSTATITTTKSNTVGGSAPVTATSLMLMSMVTVRDTGNAADTNTGSLYGAVSYSYQIGTYDVTGSQYTAFLNAVGSTDTYALYSAYMVNQGIDRAAEISQSGTSGSFTYAIMNNTGNRPISNVSWFDCARFSNWMSNGQPRGAQNGTTTENGAYNVNGATYGIAVVKNATNPNTGLAPTYRIPLENEWYKAAYYSPNYGGAGVSGYYVHATQSDTAPGTTIGSSANQANYSSPIIRPIGHATDVGSFSGSGSFYGTFDQSGNVDQWNDLDGTAGSSRGFRGGYWSNNSYGVSSSDRVDFYPPSNDDYYVGFRLASPDTTTLTPTFGATTATADGFRVQISNYDSSYTWAGTATASGSVVVSGTGLVTVTGVALATSSTAKITTTRTGFVDGSAPVSATSLLGAALTPVFGATTSTATGFTVQVTNYNALYTWAGTATASGTVVVSGTGLVTVTNVAPETSSTATITTTRTGYTGGTNTVTATPLATALTPTFGATTRTANGFTVQISNYDASYTWAGTATASGTVDISVSGLVTVTGVAAGTSSMATITTIKSNTVGGSATVNLPFFAMSMVTVGNAGNAPDTGSDYPGYGAVSYSYKIGKYDVTGSQYTAFLNAVGSTDTYGLYNASMGTDPNGYGVAQISRSGTAGTYTYAVMNGTGQRPITYVSWLDCARFSNWMSNGQPSGAQTGTTTENGAYNVNGATYYNAVAANATNPNTGLAPTFRMPLDNEWYKAAYYSPNYGGSGVGGYYRYATQNDSAPGTTIGSGANQANYNSAIGHSTDVGSFSGSGSFYGTFDQTGNVWQLNDLDGTAGPTRGLRGGLWYDGSSNVSSSGRGGYSQSSGDWSVGFRLAGPV